MRKAAFPPSRLFILIFALLLFIWVAACVDTSEPPIAKPASFAVRLVPMVSPTPIPGPLPIANPASGRSAPTPGPGPTGPPPAPTKTPEALCPLSGMPVKAESQPTLRAFALKVDNSPPAWPQSGLSQACVVIEHPTEGGITRFLAVFHGAVDEAFIGPIRSMRMVDIDLVPQFDAVFGFVGSTQRIAWEYSTSNILDMNQFFNAGTYQRISGREAPYNVYTSVKRLREATAAKDWDQASVLEPYRFSASPPRDAAPATALTIPFHSSNIVQYRYDAERGTYLRFVDDEPQTDANTGEQLEVTNVVVQYVRQRVTPYLEDANGAFSMDIQVIGEGNAEVFRDGLVVPARWVQESRTERVQFLDETGTPIVFKPGSTWIALVQTGTEVVKTD